MSNREEMLRRIREALGRSSQQVSQPPVFRGDVLPELGRVMPAIAPGDLLSKFEAELQKVGGATYRAATVPELEQVFGEILSRVGAPVVLSRNPLLADLGVELRLRALGKTVASWPEGLGGQTAAPEEEAFRERCFSAAVGITGVDFALAETGTLVLTSRNEGSQLASLAPPAHIALYRRSQVVESLEEVLEKLPVPRNAEEPLLGRSVVFITGPSRTADIEQILVRGVHGPREVHAILVEDSCMR